jgi:hypothetical protein
MAPESDSGTSPPKVFISYAWSSPEHEQWVVNLASQLRENGVNAILDKWELREGQDARAFMERMVTDPTVDKVIVICDRIYAEKSANRVGGVGIESQIMSGEIYGKVEQTKFVPVVREKDGGGQAYLPTFFKSRIFIDLSDGADEAYGMERLLRWCHDEPLNVPPPIGRKPQFLSPDASPPPRLPTTVITERGLLSGPKRNSAILYETRRYLDEVLDLLKSTDIDFPADRHADEVVVERIDTLRPLTNRTLSVIESLLSAGEHDQAVDLLHDFLERLAITNSSVSAGRADQWATDHLKFLAHYLFVQIIAAFIRHDLFKEADELLSRPFFKPTDRGYTGVGATYLQFRSPLRSLDAYNQRQAQKRLSVHADLIRRVSEGTQFDFAGFMQADFVLWLRTFLADREWRSSRGWWPVSTLFSTYDDGAFPLFIRAAALSYWVRTIPLHRLSDRQAAERFLEQLKTEPHFVPVWEFERLKPLQLMNWDNIKHHVGL